MATTTEAPSQVTQTVRLTAPGRGVWYAVKHCLADGIVTYYRDPDDASEHRDRMMVRFGKKVDVYVVSGGSLD